MGILILGTGGHAKVSLDLLLEAGELVAGFLDDNAANHGTSLHGYPVFGAIADWRQFGRRLAMGIGSNAAKKAILAKLGEDPDWVTMIHPHAQVSRFASIGAGSMIAMGACVGVDSQVGKQVVINTAATVDHDCVIGDFSHVAPGAHLSGNVTLGEGAFFGVGAVARQGISIGEWATVGAGAAVVKDVAANCTVIGVPATVLRDAR